MRAFESVIRKSMPVPEKSGIMCARGLIMWYPKKNLHILPCTLPESSAETGQKGNTIKAGIVTFSRQNPNEIDAQAFIPFGFFYTKNKNNFYNGGKNYGK